MLFKSETSKAEVDPPLFPDIFLHQTVEEEDEKSCNINKSGDKVRSFEIQDWFLVGSSFVPQQIFFLEQGVSLLEVKKWRAFVASLSDKKRKRKEYNKDQSR